MNTLRAAAVAAMITTSVLAVPAAAQVRTASTQAASLTTPTRVTRSCPREYIDHELGCTLWRVPRR